MKVNHLVEQLRRYKLKGEAISTASAADLLTQSDDCLYLLFGFRGFVKYCGSFVLGLRQPMLFVQHSVANTLSGDKCCTSGGKFALGQCFCGFP